MGHICHQDTWSLGCFSPHSPSRISVSVAILGWWYQRWGWSCTPLCKTVRWKCFPGSPGTIRRTRGRVLPWTQAEPELKLACSSHVSNSTWKQFSEAQACSLEEQPRLALGGWCTFMKSFLIFCAASHCKAYSGQKCRTSSRSQRELTPRACILR